MQFNLKSNFNYLIISALSFLSLVMAVLIQIHYKLNPCAICILTRYIIIIIGLVNLGLFFSSRKPTVISLRSISALFIAIGFGYSLRHLYIVHQKIDTCSIDKLQMFLNDRPAAKEWPWLFESTGSCLDANFSFLGVPFTMLTFSFYVVIIVLSVLPLFSKKPIGLK
jgi:protein dithiol:quinone oxidoreductase